jgi:hypothetical protein
MKTLELRQWRVHAKASAEALPGAVRQQKDLCGTRALRTVPIPSDSRHESRSPMHTNSTRTKEEQ